MKDLNKENSSMPKPMPVSMGAGGKLMDTDDDRYAEISRKFRNEACKDPTTTYSKDPSYEYKKVIVTYRHDANRVERYENEGWKIVIADVNGVLKPVSGMFEKSGHKWVWMKCTKERRVKNELKKQTDNKVRYTQSMGKKVTKKGNQTHIELPDVDLGNQEKSNETNL